MDKDKYWIGFDLGGTKMLAVVFDKDWKVVSRARKRTKGHEGKAAGLDRICKTIREALEDANLSKEQIAGIGVGCPGPLDLSTGTIREAPNLGWKDVKIKQHLEGQFGCSAFISNDVDAGVFGEYRFGAARNARCCIGIFPGTGIGGGCVYEGKIFQGANCTCMEIGHIPIVSEGAMDGCGNKGTLESVASRLVIAANVAQAAYRGQAPTIMKNCGTEVSKIRSGALAEAIKQGDKAVEKIVLDAAEMLGLAVVTMVHLMAPDVVVLGGGLVESMPEIFLENVEGFARKRVLASYQDVFKVVAAKLGDDATAMGAAAWAQSNIEET